MAVGRLLIFCGIFSLIPSGLSQTNAPLPALICPANRTVTVNMTDNTPLFEQLPGGVPLETSAEYNPGGLALWYNLAGGIIDAARPGGLPYGKGCGTHQRFSSQRCLRKAVCFVAILMTLTE